MSKSLRAFLAITLAIAGQGQPLALDLFKIPLFHGIVGILGKFPSLSGTAVELRNFLCAAHEWSSGAPNGALGDTSIGEMFEFTPRRLNIVNPEAFPAYDR